MESRLIQRQIAFNSHMIRALEEEVMLTKAAIREAKETNADADFFKYMWMDVRDLKKNIKKLAELQRGLRFALAIAHQLENNDGWLSSDM